MERVAFLVEETGTRLPCLLNPETVVVRRRAGVEARRSLAGQLTGSRLADDPLLFTGGGRTELDLDLLFDLSLAAPEPPLRDVRDLTRPLWELSENAVDPEGYGRPRRVRFVWGKAWNFPAVVSAVAERLEHFAGEGAPHRSWLRLRLVRSAERDDVVPATPSSPPPARLIEAAEAVDPGDVRTHEVVGEGDRGERLDDLAARYYGNPALWRLLAAVNGISDPPWVPPGRLLRIPSLSVLQTAAPTP